MGFLKMVKNSKSAATIKYVVNYEVGGYPYYGALQVTNGGQLQLETQHGSKAAHLNPKADVRPLTMILLLELGAKLVSLNPHSS